MAAPRPEPSWPPPVAVIGAGALGSVLALRLGGCGYPVVAVLGRSGTASLARRVGAPVASPSLHDLPETARLVACCVPDDALPAVVDGLGPLRRDWSDTTVLHTSGALTTEVLAPLAARGATTLSFHPVQTFTRASTPDGFAGIPVGLEGTEAALAVGRRLAVDLGARPVVLPAAAKTRYHLAATVASNFLVTLMALAEEVLATIGLTRPEGAALLRPLVEGTLGNLAAQPPEDALTGPVARGDAQTLAAHLDALQRHLPHLLPAYVALATETVRVAVRGARLSPDTAQALLDVLHEALESE